MQKRDGTYWLALWETDSVWTPSAQGSTGGTELFPAPLGRYICPACTAGQSCWGRQLKGAYAAPSFLRFRLRTSKLDLVQSVTLLYEADQHP